MSKTKLQMTEARSVLVAANVTLLATAKNETRTMSDSEQKSAADNDEAIKELDAQIEAADKELRNETEVVPNTKINTDMKKKFSLITAIRNQVEGTPQGEAEKSVFEAGKAEMRHCGVAPEGNIVLPSENRADILAGTATAGAEVVAEDKDSSILYPLRAALASVQAGATFLTGLVGDLSMPAYAGTTAAWKGEVAAADDGGGAFSEVTFQPLRLTAYVDVSKRFLIQDSVDAEAMLKQDIVNAVAGKLEGTIFSTSAASAGVSPAGIFTGTVTMAGIPTYQEIIGLETAVDTANALQGNLSYITNAAGRGLLKGLVKHATNPAGFMMNENNELNGYPVHVTNHASAVVNTDEDGLAFANWADLVIAQWAGIDIVVDPYTQAANGQVRLVVNAYFDAKFRRSASLAVGSINVSD